MKIRHMAMLAMYTTIALTIFTIESLLPGLAPVSGIKLGLANIVTLWLLLYASQKDAFLCLVMRILTASLIAGQMVSFAYNGCPVPYLRQKIYCFYQRHWGCLPQPGTNSNRCNSPSILQHSFLPAAFDDKRHCRRHIYRTLHALCCKAAHKRPGLASVNALLNISLLNYCLDEFFIISCIDKCIQYRLYGFVRFHAVQRLPHDICRLLLFFIQQQILPPRAGFLNINRREHTSL